MGWMNQIDFGPFGPISRLDMSLYPRQTYSDPFPFQISSISHPLFILAIHACDTIALPRKFIRQVQVPPGLPILLQKLHYSDTIKK